MLNSEISKTPPIEGMQLLYEKPKELPQSKKKEDKKPEKKSDKTSHDLKDVKEPINILYNNNAQIETPKPMGSRLDVYA